MEVKKIKEINIKYIKGIENKSFKFDLFPNKPSIFVAPNGFGKSSFTKAFLYMNQNKIKLENKEDFYKNDENNNTCSEVSINYDEIDGTNATVIATNTSNNIFTKFDVSVINSSIIPKSKNQNFGGFSSGKASLEVPSIILKNTIPSSTNFSYSFSTEKRDFGVNGKILINITDIIKGHSLVLRLLNTEGFIKLKNARPSGKISTWITHINSLNGTREDVIDQIDTSILDGFFDESVNIIKSLGFSEKENYILIYQFHKLYCSNRTNIVAIKKHYNYLVYKDNIKSTLESIGTTWKSIKAKETRGKLVLDFPDIRNISNGQRDAIVFLARLLETEEKLSSNKPLLLIIDEVFDYLDDVNIVICQYFITKFIEKFKGESKQIFPIIMTHLNPNYFKGHIFSKQRVYFLNKTTTSITNKKIHRLIFRREDETIIEDVDKYFLHYHPDSGDLQSEFTALGIDRSIGKSDDFNSFISTEFDSYLAGNRGYDPLSICTYLRIKIEKYGYNQLGTEEDKIDFLETKKTKEKLNLLVEKGINIPEIFYLLGVIYNGGMHVKEHYDWITPLRSKLDNGFIKNMIKEINIIISE